MAHLLLDLGNLAWAERASDAAENFSTQCPRPGSRPRQCCQGRIPALRHGLEQVAARQGIGSSRHNLQHNMPPLGIPIPGFCVFFGAQLQYFWVPQIPTICPGSRFGCWLGRGHFGVQNIQKKMTTRDHLIKLKKWVVIIYT